MTRLWDAGGVRPAGALRRLAALLADGVLLGWLFAWLLLPLPGLPGWGLLLLACAYGTVGDGWRGRTPGKALLGLLVLAAEGGGRVGPWRAAVRWAVRAGPVMPALVAAGAGAGTTSSVLAAVGAVAVAADHAWALRHPSGRTVHDLLAGAIVVRRPRPHLFRLSADHPWAAHRGGG